MKTTAVCLAGLLAGCASSIQVEEVGARPEAGVIGALPMAAGLGVTPELVEGLRAAGVGDGARSDAPYVLDVSYSERPVQVGAYAGAWSSDQDGAEPWLATPAKRRPWTPRQLQFCTLSVRILDAAAGAERYEVRASARGRGPSCGQDPAVLPAAVAARLTEASD